MPRIEIKQITDITNDKLALGAIRIGHDDESWPFAKLLYDGKYRRTKKASEQWQLLELESDIQELWGQNCMACCGLGHTKGACPTWTKLKQAVKGHSYASALLSVGMDRLDDLVMLAVGPGVNSTLQHLPRKKRKIVIE